MSYFNNFDIKKMVKTVREAINPELRIPTDQQTHPVNWRITRIRDLIQETTRKQDELAKDLDNIRTNLEGLLEELNQETQAPSTDTSENENVEAKPKKAKAATESKKTAEKASPKKSKPVKKETESS